MEASNLLPHTVTYTGMMQLTDRHKTLHEQDRAIVNDTVPIQSEQAACNQDLRMFEGSLELASHACNVKPILILDFDFDPCFQESTTSCTKKRVTEFSKLQRTSCI